jgi:hypothetical protein
VPKFTEEKFLITRRYCAIFAQILVSVDVKLRFLKGPMNITEKDKRERNAEENIWVFMYILGNTLHARLKFSRQILPKNLL